jgi:uncharacterized RDD family membrane protein YckC
MTDENIQRNYADFLPNYVPEIDPWEYRIGFGRRFGAYFIDTLIIMLLVMIAMFATGQISELVEGFKYSMKSLDDSMLEETMMKIVPLYAVINLVYFSSELFFGASLGKMMVGIRIGNIDRNPAGISQLIARYSIKNISVIFSLIGFMTGLLFIDIFGDLLQIIVYIGFLFTFGLRRQAFHDMLSATAVYYTNELMDNNNQLG